VVQPAKWFNIRLWNFVGLAFQTCPFQCLRIARAAENHFLAPNQNHDVANFGRCIASDENLRGSELISHLRTPRPFTKFIELKGASANPRRHRTEMKEPPTEAALMVLRCGQRLNVGRAGCHVRPIGFFINLGFQISRP
jgi:hypothetical protein